MRLQRYQHVVHGAGLVGERWQQADAVAPGRFLGGHGALGRQTTTKRVRLKASSWMAWAAMCKPKWLPARSLAIPAQAGLLAARRAPSALLDTAWRSACGRCVEPVLALCECLRMGQHDFDAIQRSGGAQMVAHQQADFANDVLGQKCSNKSRGAGNHALGAVLHRDHAKLGLAGCGGLENFVKVVARNVLDAGAEKRRAASSLNVPEGPR